MVFFRFLLWPLMEAKGLLWNGSVCAKSCGWLAPCSCRKPKNGIQSVFLRKGQRTLRAWEIEHCLETAQDIVGEEMEIEVDLPKTATKQNFFLSSRSIRKQENLVLFEILYLLFPRSQKKSVAGFTKNWSLTPFSKSFVYIICHWAFLLRGQVSSSCNLGKAPFL